MRQKEITDLLRAHGMRVTPQRVWVYGYLCEHPEHPSAERVYSALSNKGMNITRATVYNVLQALSEGGLIAELKTEGRHTRYDARLPLHGHFTCSKCGRVYDFAVEKLDVSGLDGFETLLKNVYFSGVCNKCNNK